MNYRLALAIFSVVPLLFLVTFLFKIKVRDSFRRVRTAIARINAFLQENITGTAVVQIFGQERKQYDRFTRINQEHLDANLQSIFYYAIFYPLLELVGALAVALIVWYGGLQVYEGALTLGALVAFIQYSDRFFRPISDLSEKYTILQAAMASAERIVRLLDTPPTVVDPPDPEQFDRVRGEITFEGVWFAYAGVDWVLRDVDLRIAAGERVAIVGATGAGKSTIISLLTRFYDVSRGRVLVDGVDVRHLDVGELRRLFSLVLQDVQLFSGTIAGNVRLGEASIDDQAVRRAGEAVHAQHFVEQLPEGWNSRVAERGATFSAGQKQLLSFARALAFDPRILLLDEATSNVDTETELLIRDALRKLIAGRTTIAVAHRLSTIEDMDKILVLHKGELREAGSHGELLALRGLYHRLYELQYAEQAVAVRNRLAV
jgi:ABC-type multidrug transport system fused ATPase/permease subunit